MITVAFVWLDVTVFVPNIAVALAVLIIDPASKSACVVTWVALQVVDAAGTNGLVAPVQATPVILLSVTV